MCQCAVERRQAGRQATVCGSSRPGSVLCAVVVGCIAALDGTGHTSIPRHCLPWPPPSATAAAAANTVTYCSSVRSFVRIIDERTLRKSFFGCYL